MTKSKLALNRGAKGPHRQPGRFALPTHDSDLEKSGKKYTLPKKSAVSHLHPVKPSKKPRSPKITLEFTPFPQKSFWDMTNKERLAFFVELSEFVKGI